MTNQNDRLYDAPGVRASISALLAQPATDAWQTVLRQVGREYRPLTDTQAHQMCLRLHEETCGAEERTRLRDTLGANCAPLALKAARDFASQFGGDWRAALAAAYEIMQVQLPNMRQSVSRRGVVTLVPTGYNAKKALVNLHGWLVLSFNTDMVKKAQQNRASANTTTTQDMAFAKQAWAASLDRLGNTFRPESALDARKTCIQRPDQRESRNGEWLTPTFLIEWDKLSVAVNFALRPVRREEVSFGVAGLRAVRQAAEAEVARLGARVRVTHTKAIQDLITKKGFSEEAAVKTVLNKLTEQPRRLLRTLAESPDILTVWLSGQTRPDSLDAGRDTDERSPAEQLQAPEQLRPQYAAAFAPADLHVARDLLAQTGAAALNVARVDLRRLIRTARQVDRERQAQQVWEEVCREAGVHCDTAARDARFLLHEVGGRWAETLSDEQISGIKALADEWNDGFEGQDRIPYLRLTLAFRRYGRHLVTHRRSGATRCGPWASPTVRRA
ncbi:hypothetical protein [Deinococcus multiflagellatus]|uniref:Uncharacterized protein n=1 Tax=Deinococcus multiflagellatus TaxID=1656887 RepID=A0ABW1ZTL2_9DEIO